MASQDDSHLVNAGTTESPTDWRSVTKSNLLFYAAAVEADIVRDLGTGDLVGKPGLYADSVLARRWIHGIIERLGIVPTEVAEFRLFKRFHDAIEIAGTPAAEIKPGTIERLEPSERIELELFRKVLQDVAEEPTRSDIGQLIQMTTDLVSGGSMSKDDALRGLISCLIVRVKSARDEAVASSREAGEWNLKWKAVVESQRLTTFEILEGDQFAAFGASMMNLYRDGVRYSLDSHYCFVNFKPCPVQGKVEGERPVSDDAVDLHIRSCGVEPIRKPKTRTFVGNELVNREVIKPCHHDLEVSPSGNFATCRLCPFVGKWRDGAWERVPPAEAAPGQNLDVKA